MSLDTPQQLAGAFFVSVSFIYIFAMGLISLELFIMVLLILGLASLFILWLYYDRRDRVLYDAERQKRTFFCVKCSSLYTAKSDVDVAKCPHCHFENHRLRF